MKIVHVCRLLPRVRGRDSETESDSECVFEDSKLSSTPCGVVVLQKQTNKKQLKLECVNEDSKLSFHKRCVVFLQKKPEKVKSRHPTSRINDIKEL